MSDSNHSPTATSTAARAFPPGMVSSVLPFPWQQAEASLPPFSVAGKSPCTFHTAPQCRGHHLQVG